MRMSLSLHPSAASWDQAVERSRVVKPNDPRSAVAHLEGGYGGGFDLEALEQIDVQAGGVGQGQTDHVTVSDHGHHPPAVLHGEVLEGVHRSDLHLSQGLAVG